MMSLSSPPTALFIADPLLADGAINEAHTIGLQIPDELSILGFDDTDARYAVYPTMTAVCQDSRELGRLAFELLLRHCAMQPTERANVSLGSAWLEVNHSTGRAPSRPIRVLPSGKRLETVHS
jgi:DNA-binding LacI/PurR family transcriptional regulator